MRVFGSEIVAVTAAAAKIRSGTTLLGVAGTFAPALAIDLSGGTALTTAVVDALLLIMHTNADLYDLSTANSAQGSMNLTTTGNSAPPTYNEGDQNYMALVALGWTVAVDEGA